MMKKILVVSILMMTSLSQAWAYQFTKDFSNGFYWANLPIDITVIDSDPVRKARIESIVNIAINEWESAVGQDIWQFYMSEGSTSSSGRNVVRWSNNFQAETNMNSATTLAAAIRYTNGPYIARTEIVINGSHSVNQNDYNLKTILTHEFGHTVGLDHSEDPAALMAPNIQYEYPGITSDDMNGMNAVLATTHKHQSTGYISPLSQNTSVAESKSPMSCATVSQVGASGNMFSLLGGFLMSLVGFIRKRLFK